MTDIAWNDTGHDTVLRLLAARTGLSFRADQRESTRQGIQRVMKRADVRDIHEFARKLEHDVDALDDLIVELTVGETYFFRETKHFDYIRSDMIPEIRRRRGNDHTIRIWSAGCASGEEAYSLSMLCEQEGLGKRSHILATDISSEALGKAREASYREWSLRGEGAKWAKPFLRFEGDHHHVDQRICQRVQFEFLNLALDVYPSYVTGTMNLDIILCRNVMIYFDSATIAGVARRFYDSLAPGGWMITASGDPPIDKHVEFETVVTSGGVFYRRPFHATSNAIQQRPVESFFQPEQVDPVFAPHVEAPVEPVAFVPTPALSTNLAKAEAISETIEDAKAALLRSDYKRAAELTKDLPDNLDACIVHVKALANIDTMSAVRACALAAEAHLLSAEIHYLHAVLLLELNHEAEAIQAAKQAIYLDRTLAIAHFTLGSILQRRGELDEARRHFRNTRNLCNEFAPDAIVAFTDGETALQLAEAAEVHLKICDR